MKNPIKLPIQKFSDTIQENHVKQSKAVEGHLNKIVNDIDNINNKLKTISSSEELDNLNKQVLDHYEKLSKRITLLNTNVESYDDDFTLFAADVYKDFDLVNAKINKLENKKGFFGRIFSWIGGLFS